MARLRRYFVEGLPLHVIVRGNDRMTVYRDDADCGFFRKLLLDASDRHGLAIHAYVLMSNHVHLLVTPETAQSAPKTLQSVGRRYVQYFNRRHERTGTLWEGRYRATAVDSETYLFECMRYIELNPVRAGMKRHPGEYRWSSYGANAEGRADPLVTPHDLYQSLGATPFERFLAYRAFVAQGMNEHEIEHIRACTNKAWALGGPEFKDALALQAERRSQPQRRGPSSKTAEPRGCVAVSSLTRNGSFESDPK